MNGQRRRRYFAAGCSFTIVESRRGDWVVSERAASFFWNRINSSWPGAKQNAGRLFWPLGWLSQ